MKFKGTALMAAAFLSIVLYYFFIDLPAEQKESLKKEQANKVLPFNSEKVLEFSLLGDGQPITLKRRALKIWDIISPLSTASDSNEVEAFISEIVNLKKTRVVEENPQDFSTYGFNSASLKIHFKLENNTEETLLIGDESPMGGNLYFKRKNHTQIMMAAISRSSLDKSVDSFRDRTLLTFNTASIKRIKIVRENNPLELTKKSESWKVSGDSGIRGDKDAVMSFLRSVQFSRVLKFVEENPKSLQTYGLNPPELKLILEDDEGKTHALDIGSPDGEKGYFGKIKGSENIVLVNTKLFQTLSQKTVAFLEKKLIEFDEKEILEMSIKSENETIRMIRRGSEKWSIESPEKTSADLSTINSLIFDLKEARVTEFVKISMDIPKTFGLDIPGKSFALKMTDGKSWTLQLGNETSNSQQVFANRTGELAVFSISRDVVEKLFRSFHDLRNKKILKFESAEINKIVIKTPENLFEMKKKGTEWNLAKPEMVKTGHLGPDLIWTLEELEFNSIVTPLLSPGLGGLDPPLFTISLWKNSEEKIATLEIGKLFKPEQEYLVQSGHRQYRVKNKFLDSIPWKLEGFKLK